jgi:DNA gyrase C-terminal domain, beta-propeller
MSGCLLVVTADGYGKRVPLNDLKATKHAGTKGVRFASAEPAAVLVVGRKGRACSRRASAPRRLRSGPM